MFNKSMAESDVPEEWKLANVTPIFKKGRKALPCNYRPVSLTSQVCKIMESIIRDKMIEHISTWKLLRDSQHGFMRSRSCLTNVLTFLEKVTEFVDDGSPVDVIYLDFQKAFDKVPHERLLLKLKAHGIDENVLLWIRKWLVGRRQRVVLNGVTSTWKPVESGVPQGSVLGPTLFLIYVNDMDSVVEVLLLKFADDSKLYDKVKTEVDRQRIQRDLVRLVEWSEDWQMSFNVQKCKVMHIGHNNPEHSYSMNGEELQTVEEEKDLGIVITKDLKPSNQCVAAVKAANRTLGMFNRSFEHKTIDTVKTVYKSLIRPHLEYCVQAWSPSLKKDIALMESVQRRATKLVPELKDKSYDERLNVFNLTSHEERRERGDMIQTFQIIKGKQDIKADQFFEKTSVKHTRGHSEKLYKKPVRLNIRKTFFSQRVVTNWNNLSRDVVAADSVNEFKGRYDRNRTRGATNDEVHPLPLVPKVNP
jgi:hypothetical protein